MVFFSSFCTLPLDKIEMPVCGNLHAILKTKGNVTTFAVMLVSVNYIKI